MALNLNPNAAQKRWRNNIVQFSHNRNFFLFQIHHVVGRTYIHNKVPIGHWFILPLEERYHDTHSPDLLNVTHFPKAFTEEFGMQRDIFAGLVDEMEKKGFYIPPADVLAAIADTSY